MDTGTAITSVVALTLFIAATSQLTNLVKFLRAGDWNGVLTQVAAAVVAYLVITAFAHSSWGDLVLPALDKPLNVLSGTDLIIVAVAGSSAAGWLFERTKARDASQSAATPSLLPGADTE